MEMTPTPFEALKIAVDRAGGQSAVSRICGVTQPAVWRWLNVTLELPAEHVLAVEAATGVSRHWLRPDIYPVENIAPQHRWIGLDQGCGHVTFPDRVVPNQAVPERHTAPARRTGTA